MTNEIYEVPSCSHCPFMIYDDEDGLYRCFQYSNTDGSIELNNISSSFVIGNDYRQITTVHEDCPLKNKSITIKLSNL